MRVMVVVVNAAASMEEIEKACDGGTASDEIKRGAQRDRTKVGLWPPQPFHDGIA